MKKLFNKCVTNEDGGDKILWLIIEKSYMVKLDIYYNESNFENAH